MSDIKSADYNNENQQNLISAMTFLAEDYFTPKNIQEVADGLGVSRNIAFRTLWNLEKAGWAEEVNGGYRLAPKLTKLAESARHSLNKLIKTHLSVE